MADNTTLDAGAGGDSIVTREISHAGDTSKLPGSFLMGITGSEGSYTAAAINGDASNGLDVDVTRVSGNVTVINAGTFAVQAVCTNAGTFATQAVCTNAGTFAVQESGTALTRLTDIETNTDSLAVVGNGSAATAQRVTIANDSTGVITATISGTVTVGSHAVTNAGTFAVQAAQSGTWTIDLGATDNAVLDAIAASLAGTLTVGSHAVTNAGTFAVQVSSALPAGTNNIGDVDILSIAAGDNNIGNVDIVTQPARVATTDTITAKLATDTIQNGTTALTPKFAVIDAATSGDNTILAAVTSKKIRVLSVFVIAAGAVNVRFESGTGGTALTGQMNLTTNSGFVLPFNPVGWFETASGTLLNLELSGAVSVDGSFTYVEV